MQAVARYEASSRRLATIDAITLQRVIAAIALTLLLAPPSIQATAATQYVSIVQSDGVGGEFFKIFTHRKVSVNGIHIHYVIGGHGDPLVLLHGFGETWYEWRHVMPTLASHYTVIVPDIRGAGDSDRPESGYDEQTMASDIAELVHQLGYERINLVGHDIGMMVAYAYAAAHPRDVRRLVVMDAPLPGIPPFDQITHSPGAWHIPFQQAPDLPEALVAGRERLYLTYHYQRFAYNPASITDAEIDEYLRHYTQPGAMRAAFAWFRAFPQDAGENQEYAKTKLPMPVLAMGGAISNGPIMLAEFQVVASNVRGIVIGDCGHWIADERPRFFTEQLLAFLR